MNKHQTIKPENNRLHVHTYVLSLTHPRPRRPIEIATALSANANNNPLKKKRLFRSVNCKKLMSWKKQQAFVVDLVATTAILLRDAIVVILV